MSLGLANAANEAVGCPGAAGELDKFVGESRLLKS